jgi:hypothetical protein
MLFARILSWLVEVEDGGVGAGVIGGGGDEMEAASKGQHGYVFGEDVGDDGADFFGASNLDEAGDEFAAEAGALVAVSDEDAEFGFFAAERSSETDDTEDFVSGGLGIDAVCRGSWDHHPIFEAQSAQAAFALT